MKRFAISMVLVALMSSSLSADQNWTGATGDWTAGTNWDGGAAPGAGENAGINNAGTAQVLGATTAFRQLELGTSGTGTIDMTAGNLDVTPGGAWVSRGTGTGTFNQSSGVTTVAGTFFIADGGAGTGIVNLSGDALLNVGGNLLPGGRGAVGTFGTLNITDDARVVTAFLSSADQAGVLGTINISGNGFVGVQNQISLGQGGSNITTVSDSGSISSGASHIYVGFNGSSTLTVNGSGHVSSGDSFIIGTNNLSNGLMTMNGGTAQTGNGNLGGGALNIASTAGATGHLQLDGGVFTVGHSLAMGAAGTLDITGGALDLAGNWSAAGFAGNFPNATAYGGAGTFVADFEALTSGRTRITAVPEPTAGILAGLAGLFALARRRRR